MPTRWPRRSRPSINSALTGAGQAGQVSVTQSGGKLSINSAASSAGAGVTVQENGNTSVASLLGTPAKISTIIAGVNDQLTVSINGTTSTITLAAGSYTSAHWPSRCRLRSMAIRRFRRPASP